MPKIDGMADVESFGIGLGIGMLLGALVAVVINFFLTQKNRSAQVRQVAELNYLQESLQQLKGKEERMQAEIQRQTGDVNRMLAEREYLKELREKEGVEANTWKEEMRMQFEYLAQQILEKKTQAISDAQQSQLFSILQPFKDQLLTFEKRIAETYQGEIRERIQLQKEIEVLVSLNQQLSLDAQNLAQALKGDNKAQGNWGELILSRILESSGLREGKEFLAQYSYSEQNGKRLQPDVVVKLPGDRHLIIDAKVSLKAYEAWIQANGSELADTYLNQHVDSIRRHIKSLSEKYYQGISTLNSPDFVFLFMAIEPAFSAAIQHKPDLFPYGWERKIVLVSPSSMLATLKTVSSVWQAEYQNQNAQEIARQGGLLYDKFVGFVEEMESLGKNLERARQSHQEAMQKLRTGNGNLIDKAERLRGLGAKSKKRL
ncbi:MAG: DNA recombination protein RmuC [Bacteroidota bacterium]